MLKPVALMVGESFRVAPGTTALTLVETVGRLVGLLRPVFLALLVNGLATAQTSMVVSGAVGLVAASALKEVLDAVGVSARVRLMVVMGFHFDHKILDLLGQLPTVEHLQDAEVADRVRLLTEEQGTLGYGINRLLNVLHNTVFAVGTIVVALSASVWMVIPLVVSAVALTITPWISRIEEDAETRSAAPGRQREALVDALCDPDLSEDSHTHGAQAVLRARLRDSVAAWRAPTEGADRKVAWLTGLESVVFFVAAGLAMVLAARDAAAGVITVGALAQAFLLVEHLSGTAGLIKFTGTLAMRSVRSMDRYLWLQDYARVLGDRPADVGAALPAGVSLVGVTYRYPGAEAAALGDVSVHFPSGQTVVLVGENGSGKSTMVNLMLGLLEPTSGQVGVHGRPATERGRVTAVGQDFVRLELTARDAVGFGDEAVLGDDDALDRAAGLGFAGSVVDRLGEGWEQQLGDSWPGGVGLSQGQWQRLALSRGLLRRGSALACFDEPSSALDPETERAMVTSLVNGAAREHLGRDCVVVFVTHRLTAARLADRIVVLDAGRVAQIGSHDELIRADGPYARLYALQASGYVT